MKHFFVLAWLMLSVGRLSASLIECEKKENFNYGYGAWKGCKMQSVTDIDSPESIISPRDETIEGLSFQNNLKILFLPVKVAETFPNLLGYYAGSCSLTEVSKSNFANLDKLVVLILGYNQIVKIASNTFEDLTSLEHLYLSSNKIKAINEGVFLSLKKLTTVHLNGNVCIDDYFEGVTRIKAMRQIVTQKCGFSETVDQILMNQTVLELENCQSENTKLNTELVAANDLKDCNDMVHFKTSEIVNLMAVLKAKNEEITAKNLKIKHLEERIKILDAQNQW